jgi:hypothetical protein
MANGSDENVVSMGRIGPVTSGDGPYSAHRLDKTGALVTGNAHGWWHEAASRGKLFIASIGAAGVAPGTALSTSPALTIWNPAQSGIHVSILQVFVGYVSGTLGAGMMVHAYNPSQATAPSGGTAISPTSALLNTASGIAKAYTGSTISATSVLLRPSMNLGAGLASTAAFPSLVMDEVAGGIVIPAGAAWCYQGIAAGGSTPLISIGVVYEEITLPS